MHKIIKDNLFNYIYILNDNTFLLNISSSVRYGEIGS